MAMAIQLLQQTFNKPGRVLDMVVNKHPVDFACVDSRSGPGGAGFVIFAANCEVGGARRYRAIQIAPFAARIRPARPR
jgi:hypothetical protein